MANTMLDNNLAYYL